MIIIKAIAAFIICYLIGAIPTAYIMGKKVKGIDIRQHGSGNVGGTNAIRVLGKVPGLITLIFDIFKGIIAISIAKIFIQNELLLAIAGLCTVCGHNWSIYIGFSGGKGVATGFGIFLALAPVPSILAFAIWVISLFVSRIVSISSIIAAISLPLFIFFFSSSKVYFMISIILGLLTIYLHRLNIERLIQGTEKKINQK